MASNRQRAKLNKRLFSKLREVGGSEIEISCDPLGALYEVNKHGLHVDGQDLQDTYDRLLALLMIEGWTVAPEKLGSIEVAMEALPESAKAYIERPYPAFPGSEESRMRITVL